MSSRGIAVDRANSQATQEQRHISRTALKLKYRVEIE
jgi:hypothetical protein